MARGRQRRGYSMYPEYVPVSRRRAKGDRLAKAAAKKGKPFQPVQGSGRTIAATFWGRAWCRTLEAYGDYANRIPRGRTYIRNGSVIDLRLERGRAAAIVVGSSPYNVTVAIDPLAADRWAAIRAACAGRIDSLVDLLSGTLSASVMSVLTADDGGLFPAPGEIRLRCSCPDGATVCKHVAAALYGIGVRFDDDPALFFLLRGVDHLDLVAAATGSDFGATPVGSGGSDDVHVDDLAGVFDIDIDIDIDEPPPGPSNTFSAAELMALGIPRSTISSWLRRGVLSATGTRGVYGTTATTGDTLEAYFERRS